MSRYRTVMEGVTALALIVASGAMTWSIVGPKTDSVKEPRDPRLSRPQIKVPDQPVPLDGAVIRGSESARVGILQFSDFQCKYCSKFVLETLPLISKKYVEPGLLRFAFRNLPPDRSRTAIAAAELARCANDTGRFWTVHDSFFNYPLPPDAEDFRRRALGAGMTESEIDGCAKSGAAAERVRDDMKLGTSLGLTGTPTFLVGTLSPRGLEVTEVLLGARPVPDFERAIDAALTASGSPERSVDAESPRREKREKR